jgi:hypothetical protein
MEQWNASEAGEQRRQTQRQLAVAEDAVPAVHEAEEQRRMDVDVECREQLLPGADPLLGHAHFVEPERAAEQRHTQQQPDDDRDGQEPRDLSRGRLRWGRSCVGRWLRHARRVPLLSARCGAALRGGLVRRMAW